ncbi:30S ribosomal protein S15 [Candidatus Pacearchaeota archaeon]|nr:30S ribosomal protein S15 [Candidatus Pacearchaeota archaeon]
MVKKETSKETGKKTTERAKLEDIEKVIVDLGKKGLTPSKIGIELKKNYGVDKVKTIGISITKVLKKNNVSYDNDLKIVSKRILKLESHLNKNKQDKRAKRELVKFVGLRKKLEIYESRRTE